MKTAVEDEVGLSLLLGAAYVGCPDFMSCEQFQIYGTFAKSNLGCVHAQSTCVKLEPSPRIRRELARVQRHLNSPPPPPLHPRARARSCQCPGQLPWLDAPCHRSEEGRYEHVIAWATQQPPSEQR